MTAAARIDRLPAGLKASASYTTTGSRGTSIDQERVVVDLSELERLVAVQRIFEELVAAGHVDEATLQEVSQVEREAPRFQVGPPGSTPPPSSPSKRERRG